MESLEERNGFLSSWQNERGAKITSCGISGPAGPQDQEMIKRSHGGSELWFSDKSVLQVCLKPFVEDV